MEEKVAAIIAALRERYPDALCALHYGKDYELMISVRLSAQCTDARVNQVTPALFARYPTLDAFAEADVAEVEEYVRSCGFFHHKAQDIVAACRMLRDEYGGRVPDTMEQLLRLPGVGRKTANLLLGKTAYADGAKITGTMPDNGAMDENFDGLTATSCKVPAGYTSGGTVRLTSDIEDALSTI